MSLLTSDGRLLLSAAGRLLLPPPLTEIPPLTYPATLANNSGGVLISVYEQFGRALATTLGAPVASSGSPARLSFDGVNDRLQIPLTDLRISNRFHIFIVAAIRNLPSSGLRGIMEVNSTSTAAEVGGQINRIRYAQSGANVSLTHNQPTCAVPTRTFGTLALNTPAILEVAALAGARRLARLNGAGGYNDTSDTPTSITGFLHMNVGVSFGGYGDIQVYEVRVYPRLLADPDAAAVRAALGAAYGISTI